MTAVRLTVCAGWPVASTEIEGGEKKCGRVSYGANAGSVLCGGTPLEFKLPRAHFEMLSYLRTLQSEARSNRETKPMRSPRRGNVYM